MAKKNIYLLSKSTYNFCTKTAFPLFNHKVTKNKNKK